MAGQRDIARMHWGQAQKVRAEILGKVKKEHGSSSYTTRFEEADETMAQFRLACMTVIFHDFEYAVEKKVEQSLWQCHTYLNGEYRKSLGRLTTSNQAVQRRKLDKLYRTFLRTSEQFYFVYIQQLSNRFTIPELQQIAYKGKQPPPAKATVESVSPAAPLRSMVLKSCRMTLIRLGDLARYRCQLSDHVSETIFKTALDYYGLANSLDPDDGSAHHQLAVLHKLVGQHFDIVYHFHRAIAISKAHELALKNLEVEFKSPESSSQTRRGAAKDPSQAMLTWFVRLHAFFFHGKHFSQQSELETEVLHRVELALKDGGSDNTLLLKMILVNIAAYDISTERVKSAWTMEGSQSCQFLLRFNMRTMLTVVRALDNALRDEDVITTGSDSEAKDGESCVSFAPALLKLLPLFRLYLAWTYVTRADLMQYQEYLEPFNKELYSLLADVLTSLNLCIAPATSTVPSMYLLLEDTEAQGLRPLNDRRLPLFLRVEEQQSSNPPKRVKIRKSQQNVFGRRFKEETEAVWRIRDIICCGALLAGSAKFPLALTTRNENGHDIETWVLRGDATNAISSNENTLSRLMTKLKFGDIKGNQENNKEVETTKSQPQETTDSHIPTPEIASKTDTTQLDKAPSKDQRPVAPSTVKLPPTVDPDSDLSQDDEMVNMVNKLVDPEEDDRPGSGHAHMESSYGMHSATANEIFGNVENGHIQPSPVSRTIPNLPWNYFYDPAPRQSKSQEQNQLSPISHSIPRGTTGQFDRLSSSPYLENLSASYNQSSMSPRPNPGYLHNSPMPTASSPALPRRDYGMNTLEGSRNAVLDSLASALLAQHGLVRNGSSGGNLNAPQTAPLWGQQNGGVEHQYHQMGDSEQASEYKHTSASTYIEGSGDRHAFAMQPPGVLGLPGQGRPVLGQGPLSSGTNRFSSSFDAQNIWGQGLPDYRQQQSPWPSMLPTTGSSLAFSHPSSLITGTPGAVSAAAPANHVALNGRYYNDTTPFSPLGDAFNNGADLTPFGNQPKPTTGGSSESSYDQQFLHASMSHNSRNPRSKC